MKTLLVSLLLVAASVSADTPKREPFPSDYKPQPCAADAAAVCESFSKGRIASYATTFRGYDLQQEWIDAHWDELTQAFRPMCAKIGNCFTVKANGWVYCIDVLRDEFLSTCDRFPEGNDRDQCRKFTMTYYVGLGTKAKLHEQSQKCAEATPAEGGRLEAWIEPAMIEPHFDGKIIVYAIDSETRIPVNAEYSIDGDSPLRSTEGLRPNTGYDAKWRAKYKRVPNQDGHTDLAAPAITLTAPGYEPLTLALPMTPVRPMTAVMEPAVLKRGKNTFTVTATGPDGKPVWGHVMAGDLLVGETNKPLVLELKKGEKQPEIWVRSLYDMHHDVVVLPAAR